MVTIGTIFERSHLPIKTWVAAFPLVCSSKKGVSAHQLHRQLKIAYNSAWHMPHRIREAMREEPVSLMLSGAIEADGTYIGGQPRRLN